MLSHIWTLSTVLTPFSVVVTSLTVSPVDDAAVLLAVLRPQSDFDPEKRLPDDLAVCTTFIEAHNLL